MLSTWVPVARTAPWTMRGKSPSKTTSTPGSMVSVAPVATVQGAVTWNGLLSGAQMVVPIVPATSMPNAVELGHAGAHRANGQRVFHGSLLVAGG